MATDTEIAKKAKAYLDARLAAVDGITKAVAARARADEQISTAYQAALDAGWTQGELKELGVNRPTGFTPRGKKGASASTKPAADTASTPEQHAENDHQQ